MEGSWVSWEINGNRMDGIFLPRGGKGEMVTVHLCMFLEFLAKDPFHIQKLVLD